MVQSAVEPWFLSQQEKPMVQSAVEPWFLSQQEKPMVQSAVEPRFPLLALEPVSESHQVRLVGPQLPMQHQPDDLHEPQLSRQLFLQTPLLDRILL